VVPVSSSRARKSGRVSSRPLHTLPLDELDQTDECIAAFQKLAACLVATPCAELTEASCEAEADAMAGPCGE
jgi:hypothetical protein